MAKLVVLGIGNAGGQVAALAQQKYPKNISSFVINTAESDLSTVKLPSNRKFLMGDTEGSGANRADAQEYWKRYYTALIGSQFFKDFKKASEASTRSESVYTMIIGSCGGGTGSGMVPLALYSLKAVLKKSDFILAGILPDISEDDETRIENALKFLDEVTSNVNDPYILYDNGKIKLQLNPNQLNAVKVRAINNEIVEDMAALLGVANKPSPFNQIDDQDRHRLLTTPGRLAVARLIEAEPDDLAAKDPIESIQKRYQTSLHPDSHVVEAETAAISLSLWPEAKVPSESELLGSICTPRVVFSHSYEKSRNNVSSELTSKVYKIEKTKTSYVVTEVGTDSDSAVPSEASDGGLDDLLTNIDGLTVDFSGYYETSSTERTFGLSSVKNEIPDGAEILVNQKVKSMLGEVSKLFKVNKEGDELKIDESFNPDELVDKYAKVNAVFVENDDLYTPSYIHIILAGLPFPPQLVHKFTQRLRELREFAATMADKHTRNFEQTTGNIEDVLNENSEFFRKNTKAEEVEEEDASSIDLNALFGNFKTKEKD